MPDGWGEAEPARYGELIESMRIFAKVDPDGLAGNLGGAGHDVIYAIGVDMGTQLDEVDVDVYVGWC